MKYVTSKSVVRSPFSFEVFHQVQINPLSLNILRASYPGKKKDVDDERVL